MRLPFITHDLESILGTPTQRRHPDTLTNTMRESVLKGVIRVA